MSAQIHQYTAPVITQSPESTIHDALLSMQINDIKHVVIAKNGFPVGVVTERDIGKFLEFDKTSRTLDRIQLDEIMSSADLVTINHKQTDIPTQCAYRMDAFHISSVIVVAEDKKLVGISTKADLVKNFSKMYRGIYKVQDYMSKRLVTCKKTDPLLYALHKLNQNKISRLVVTDEDGSPIGVITYDTFLRNSGYFKLDKSTRDYLTPAIPALEMIVGNLVESELLTVDCNDDMARATELMAQYKVSGIPVVGSEGSLEGIISSTDIVRSYTKI